MKTISSLEVVSAEERIINCCPEVLPMALWPGLFVHSEAMPSFGKQYLSTIRNFQGAQFSLSESYLKKKKKERKKGRERERKRKKGRKVGSKSLVIREISNRPESSPHTSENG